MNVPALYRQWRKRLAVRIGRWQRRRYIRRQRSIFYTYSPNPNARSVVRQFGPRPR